MTAPLISVVLPVFNGGAYLERAVRSVLIQDHADFELIAIDDGSRDESLAVLRGLERRDPRMRVIARDNRGLVYTLNEGLALAQAPFVARMDADDISYPTRFSRQVAAFRRNP